LITTINAEPEGFSRRLEETMKITKNNFVQERFVDFVTLRAFVIKAIA
jgi:hypothetical protein